MDSIFNSWRDFVHKVLKMGHKTEFKLNHDCIQYTSHDMTKLTKWLCASEDSDQPGHPPSLIRDFAVHLMGSWGPKLSPCGQWRLWSDWADAQADLSLRWAHSHFVGFVMPWLKLQCTCSCKRKPTLFLGYTQPKRQIFSRKKKKKKQLWKFNTSFQYS